MFHKHSRPLYGIAEPGLVVEEELNPTELSREWLDELLNPEGWRPILETFAGTVKLAVALTDLEGRQLGECLNPQPIWRMAQAASAEIDGGCPFCLAPLVPCRAVAEALETGGVVMAQDQAGLAHVATPLYLGGQPLAALIAGQVLNRYAEPLRLQRVARKFGISQQQLWHEALQQVPITQATLQVYADLLMVLGQAYLGQRYAAILHRKLIESNQRVRRSLTEKEVLLREIHHRVKNNLQIVSSLLNMQANRLDDVNDARGKAALQESQQRITGMATIHDLLYGSEQVGEIDLAEYVKKLAQIVISSFQSEAGRIRALFDVKPTFIGMSRAIPCGLIVNELLTNILKYAYPSGEGGEIYISVALAIDNRVSIKISDRGVGLPEGLDWRNSDSLGLRIIRILTKQIGGTFQLDTQSGVSSTIEFPG
jgi:two-component sensor histidine kinase